MSPQPYDLFGEIPVTWPEVADWLASVPGMSLDSPRAAWYIRAYNVIEKIRAWKKQGTAVAVQPCLETR